jgi:hypothetical protein
MTPGIEPETTGASPEANTNYTTVLDNKRYQVPKKELTDIDSDSSESGDDENENDKIL